MKIKARWYCLNPFDAKVLDRILKSLKRRTYTETNGSGFLVDEWNDTYCKLRYIEKFQNRKEVISPMGESTEYTEVTYSISGFTLSTEWPHLRLESGFRSATKLLNQLGLAVNFEIAIVPVSFDLTKVARELCKSWPEVIVSAASLRNIQLDTETHANVDVASGRNALGVGLALADKKPHELRSVTCAYRDRILGQCKVTVTAEGQVQLDGQDPEGIHEAVLAVLKNAWSS